MSDLISRQDAIRIVDQFSREEMFHYMESLELDVRATQICHSAIEAVGTIKEQIEALPSAVCDDCIWHICNYNKMINHTEDYAKGYNDAKREIALSGEYERCYKRGYEDASADRPTGEWVLKEHLWECDKCGCRINRANPLKGNIWNYNYCPNCGAYMEGEKHE